ncbi:MAG TPA: hypothetical protein VNC60_05285, partial [Actinomycetota bacterium]|nr:hypothetical protein [Actinomycetota bacterium]
QNPAALAAATIARELDDDELFGRAALTVVETWVLLGMASPRLDPEVMGLLDEAVERLGHTPIGIRLRAYRMDMLGVVAPRSVEEADELIAAARRSGDAAAVAAAMRLTEWASLTDIETIESMHAQLRGIGRQTGDPMSELATELSEVILRMINGDLAASVAAVGRFEDLVERFHLGVYRWLPAVWRVAQHVLAGRFDDAERAWSATTEGLAGKVARYAIAIASFSYFEICRQRGQLEPLVDAVGRSAARADDPAFRCAHVLALVETGNLSDARVAYAAHKARPIAPTALYFLPAQFHFRTLVAHRLDDAELGEDLYSLGKEFADLIVVGGPFAACYGSAQYALGLAASLCERWKDAEEHFTLARERNAAIESPPWVAYTEYDHALMLSRQGRAKDRTRARELGSSALAAAQALDMARLAREAGELLARL